MSERERDVSICIFAHLISVCRYAEGECLVVFEFVYGFARSCSNTFRPACTQRRAPAHTKMKFEILYACDTFFFMYVQAFLS